MKKLFRVTAINHNNRDVVIYNDVYDINHLWDAEHDSLRLMMWTDKNSTARREFINMNENDILIVQESI